MSVLVNTVTRQQIDVDILAAYPDQARTQSVEYELLGANTSVWGINPIKFVGGRFEFMMDNTAANRLGFGYLLANGAPISLVSQCPDIIESRSMIVQDVALDLVVDGNYEKLKVTMSWRPSSAGPIHDVATWTYADAAAKFSTYADAQAAFSRYDDARWKP